MKHLYLLIALLIFSISNSQNTTIIEKKIYFEYNQFNLSQTATTSLDSLVTVCNKYSNYTLKIVGYTDSSGSAKYNKKLSNDRSKAVFDYLSNKKLNQNSISHQGFGVDNKSENETFQRNTTVTFIAKSDDCFYKLNSLTAKNGTEVTFKLKNVSNADFSVEEYFSTQNMIVNEKFALDINDEVLETAGMIDIDLKNINPNDIEDGIITVSIPTISNADYDEEMSIWVEETDKNGNRRWKNSKIKPKWNKVSKRYEFSLNTSNFRNNRASINLDKNIYRNETSKITTGKDKKVIIVATENDDFFYDVFLSYTSERVNDLKFSARIDKTGFAFVIPKKLNPRALTFTGINSSSKNSFQLSKCKTSKYKNKYMVYKYIATTSTDNKKIESAKKKGFWEWLKRIFN